MEGKGVVSWGGGNILIKAIAQAVPSFSMSCFKLPTSVYTDLVQIVSRFGGVKSG